MADLFTKQQERITHMNEQTSQELLLKLSKIENNLRKETRGDDLYGGDLLRDTALAISRSIRRLINNRLKGSQPNNRLKRSQLPRNARPAEVVHVWERLVNEVVREYQWEREILEHNLELKEFRPRTFFSILPGNWQNTILTSRLKASELQVKYLEIIPRSETAGGAKERKERLSVLLPITNGYRKTFRSLACLCYDIEKYLDKYDVQFHICVNYSDDNSIYEVTRFANTIGYSRAIPITLYHAEKPNQRGHRGRQGRWWKTDILNFMLNSILRTQKKEKVHTEDGARPQKEHFLHFADDDIYISPGDEVIEKNIQTLRENRELKIISASYSSEEDWGFSAVSSVRKRRGYIESRQDDRLFNIYGGCMTTTVERLLSLSISNTRTKTIKFPRAIGRNKEFGEDSYLTALANLHLLEESASKRTSKIQSLRGYATRQRVVGHQEPTNIVSFANRVARDKQWSKRSLEACFPRDKKLNKDNLKNVARTFGALRRLTFEPIASAITAERDLRHNLAQAWGYEIRAKATEWSDRARIRYAHAINWTIHKTRHQICKDIVENGHLFETILQDLTRGPVSYELIHGMRECAKDPSEQLSQICRLLIAVDRKSIESILHENAYLFHLYAIAEESLTYGAQFSMATTDGESPEELLGLSEEKIACLKKLYPFDLALILAKAFPGKFENCITVSAENESNQEKADYLFKHPRRSPRSYSIFLQRNPARTPSDHDKGLDKLFLRYHTVIGRGKFLKDSPRRIVYLHVLGEEIVKTILNIAKGLAHNTVDPELQVLKTMYPTLKQSMLHYAGPERHAPFDRLMQSLYIQDSIKGKAKQLSRVVLGDNQCRQLSTCMESSSGKCMA